MPSPTRRLLLRASASVAGVAAACAVAGCGGSSAGRPPARTPPDLAAFLRLPVATPTSCPDGVRGTTSGRRSPWVGRVDVSVFLSAAATPAAARRLGRKLRSLEPVQSVYFESKAEAYAEFQRLYTCSAEVRRRAAPASYRLVLGPVTQPVRDDLVRTVRSLDGVRSLSCDPSNPCVGK